MIYCVTTGPKQQGQSMTDLWNREPT
jgi:hypothetical protein